jgi:hypothetical protein
VKHKVDIPRPLSVVAHKVLIALGPLLLRVGRQHALQADAYTLDVVDGRPALSVEQVEADDAVGVNVRVPRDGVAVGATECHFWWLCGV